MTDSISELTGTLRGVGRAGPSRRHDGVRPRSRSRRPPSAAREAEALGRLTDREKDVVALTARGHRRAEIGGALDMSPEAVDALRSRAMNKLQITHRSQLVRFAWRGGLRPAAGAQSAMPDSDNRSIP